MTLLTNTGGATTTTVGYFDADSAALADWMARGFGDEWIARPALLASERDALGLLVVSSVLTRYLCVPLGSWTALLTNGPLGTDVGVLPSYAARELRCRAIRAVNVDKSSIYPARMLEVYGPEGEPPLAAERSIAAANDGGRWVFETFGAAYPFEDQSAYARRAKADRFTSEMLLDYLRALGVPVDKEPDWSMAVLVERARGRQVRALAHHWRRWLTRDRLLRKSSPSIGWRRNPSSTPCATPLLESPSKARSSES